MCITKDVFPELKNNEGVSNILIWLSLCLVRNLASSKTTIYYLFKNDIIALKLSDPSEFSYMPIFTQEFD